MASTSESGGCRWPGCEARCRDLAAALREARAARTDLVPFEMVFTERARAERAEVALEVANAGCDGRDESIAALRADLARARGLLEECVRVLEQHERNVTGDANWDVLGMLEDARAFLAGGEP